MGDYDIFVNLNNFMKKGSTDVDIDDDIEVDKTVVEMDKNAGKKKKSKKRKNEEVDLLKKKNRTQSSDSSNDDDTSQSLSQKTDSSSQNGETQSSNQISGASSVPAPVATTSTTVPAKRKRGRPSTKKVDDIDEKLKSMNTQYNKVMKMLKEDEKKERQSKLQTFDKNLQQFTKAAQRNQRNPRKSDSLENRFTQLQTMFSNPIEFLKSLEGSQGAFLPDDMSDDDDDVDDISDDEYPIQDCPIFVNRAQRHENIEVIDLVSSPLLIVPGVQNLDSEDEYQEKMKKLQSPQLDTSLDSENYEMTIKIKWHGEVQRFKHRKHQKFGELIQKLADREQVDPQFILLDINEKIVRSDDTPDSIGYTVSTFICGRVVKSLMPSKSRPQKRDENIIILKIQSDKWKKPLEVNIGKDKKMKVLLIKCSEELKCSASRLTLFFDGDKINLEETPEDLELDGGEIIDCRMTN